MRILVALIIVSLGFRAVASPESYESVRGWVERKNSTNTIPAPERVFVWPNTDTFILRYQTNLTVRQVIDMSKLKGQLVQVTIFRKSAPSSVRGGDGELLTQRRVFSAAVGPTNNPAFAIEPEDALLIYTGPHNVW